MITLIISVLLLAWAGFAGFLAESIIRQARHDRENPVIFGSNTGTGLQAALLVLALIVCGLVAWALYASLHQAAPLLLGPVCA